MKYTMNNEQDIKDLKDSEVDLVKGDILLHKPLEIYTLQGLLTKHYGDTVEIVPATMGTDLYTIHGYNTSVVKVV